MAKAMPTAADAAAAWKSGFGGSNTKWQAGVSAVTQPPGAAAAAQADVWEANTINAKSKFKANVGKVTLGDWKQSCSLVTAGSFQAGATKGSGKYQAKIGPVLAAIGQIRDSLPARADTATNLQRAYDFGMALHNRAQQGF